MLNTGAQDLIVDRPLWKYLEEKEFVKNNVLTTLQRDTNRITSAQIYYRSLFSASLHSIKPTYMLSLLKRTIIQDTRLNHQEA